ncbi:TetR/AcrR family transcriptional regulator [Thermomonospora cellulosilytica]|uniref:AcrR family transcriptional regulator n=1 Tax=Thermomonospora cellulosilytica TaxID=1411118 RepID=A0A7W3MUN6_9ACTN|nr:TetR/AcrR family transcriptional regulator [Thermomonospora cellulosilytica]MBA9002243.1 AcrR family transcriptional regulator [Thermomonospora cellulosilytica]
MTRERARRADAEANDRALLQAAREVLAIDGAHASVARIAERAGVGIGSLYRRYRTKQELFQHLCATALDQWLRAAEEGLAHEDPWEGLAHYVRSAVAMGPGSLAPIAGTIEITPEMADKNRRSDEAAAALVERAHAAGVLRPDVTVVDLHLLIEQLGRSPLLEQLGSQGRTDLLEAARTARDRITRIALDGLRAPAPAPLPGRPPGQELLSARWDPPPA